MSITLEYDRWLYVATDSVGAARRFFGVPSDWPAEFDRFSDRGPVYRVLSSAWITQQNEARS